MASHQLAIAKASFSAGLLRPDPTSLSREDIEYFHTLLNAVITQCTPQNVQKCKHWILENIAQSTARFTALGKYLTALTTSFDKAEGNTQKREPSTRRKRLHLLYLINDILHHTKFRVNDPSVCRRVQPILVGLFGSAASFKGCPKHQRKIQNLLEVWEEKGYYSRDYIEKLREAVQNAEEGGNYTEGVASLTAEKDPATTTKLAKSAPYVMPAMHGDTTTPWFDLPAGNLMPHIVPNSTRPINPDLIKPLQFAAGPADENLVAAVKTLLDDVRTIFGGKTDQDEKSSWDIDELGQPIIVDEITGDVIDGEGYYGWSRTFCERMKKRKKGIDMLDRGEYSGRLSRSRSSSRSVRKRRHSESDDGSSQYEYRSRRRRRSYSSSRSPSPHARRNGGSHPRSRSSSYSKSPQRSPTPPRRPDPYPQEQNLSAPREGLPPKPPMPFNPPMPYQQPFNPNFPPPPPPPLHNMPFNGPGPQFGAWPPPPPPPPPNTNFNPSSPWPPPPPPGQPPMNFQHPQQQPIAYPPSGPGGWQQGDGRGYSNNGWNNGHPNRGRGNFRGRGW